uniref:mRNA (guanine-N(7))-methyltransferase n=1 Tax=viral metagenome TaxID=1070528 RepID=A0A6C0BER3_9ZZZZ
MSKKSDIKMLQLFSFIPKDIVKSISSVFSKTDENKEFEFIFFSKKGTYMNKEKYILLAKYLKIMSKTHKFINTNLTLDIGYSSDNNVYRISVNDIKNVRNIIKNVQNINYVIYKRLLYEMKTDKSLKLLKKTKNEEDNIDIDNLSLKARLSEEIFVEPSENKILNDLLTGKTIDLETRNKLNENIFFRLKERTSLFIEETDEHFIRIDLTMTKTTKYFDKLDEIRPNYELEIEYGVKNKKFVKPEHLITIYETAEKLLKITQQSSFIVSTELSTNIVQYYRELINQDVKFTNLYGRQPVSLEIQHATTEIPNKYALSDKADGDRHFLIIHNLCVYLLTKNLNVKDTGIVLDKSLEKYNGSVLDGEYVYVKSERRHLYMVFDCLRNGSTDVRVLPKLMERLENADKIIEECFIFEGQKGFKYKKPVLNDVFNIEKVATFYGNEINNFYEILKEDMKYVKNYPLIRRKYFMEVFGAKSWEIFRYSVELWNRYTGKTKFPYVLDGIIYQPLEQVYEVNPSNSKLLDYKWKSPTHNSMDFYIEFKKDPKTKEILNVYDNSLNNEEDEEKSETVRNQLYRICNIFVGRTSNMREQPVPFEENYGVSEVYLYLKNGDVLDENGDVITDKTVVEFYYINDMNIMPQKRWVPMRTRFDKTESVERFGRQYGNSEKTATRVWRSMVNPVLMEDFIELSKGNKSYDDKIKDMNSKISHQLIVSINKDKKYYQKTLLKRENLNNYHNFIKSIIIYTYTNKMYNSNIQLSVLDYSVGRGGDIYRYYYTSVSYVVGFDSDNNGLIAPDNGAISRYTALRKNKPNVPKMYFLQADGKCLLNYDDQIKALSGMDSNNKLLLQKFFSKNKPEVFDVINCQFAMHYFLQDEQSWSNFKTNVKNHLRNGGYFIATSFDAKMVMDKLKDKERYTVYYDDTDGNKKIFFDIVKKYDIKNNSEMVGVKHAIDVFVDWIFEEGNYVTEYLVDINFITKEFAEIGLELVDTDLFSNMYEMNRQFVTQTSKHESKAETKKYIYNSCSPYYDDTEMNIKSRDYTFLNRYYVFRKNVKVAKDLSGGGNGNGNGTINFYDVEKFRIPDMSKYDDEYSLYNSIHKILVSHSMIPKSVKIIDFVENMELELLQDHLITPEHIQQIANNISINHLIENDVLEPVIDGLNIYFIERDCNGFDDISYVKCENVNSDLTKNIILIQEGKLYKPIYEIDKIKGMKGLFNQNDIIDYLNKNGNKL